VTSPWPGALYSADPTLSGLALGAVRYAAALMEFCVLVPDMVKPMDCDNEVIWKDFLSGKLHLLYMLKLISKTSHTCILPMIRRKYQPDI
jgi:hypothetical protein